MQIKKKKCGTCGVEKYFYHFCVRAEARDGRAARCKACTVVARRQVFLREQKKVKVAKKSLATIHMAGGSFR